MNRYLIFRSDRIGDFLVSAVLIKGIKNNDKNAYIIVVASQKNFEYIKKFKLVDEVILLKKSLIDKLKLIYNLRKSFFKSIIVHDNKKRSHLISFFLNSKNKIKIKNKNFKSHIEIVKDILTRLNFSYNDSYLNTIENRKIKDENLKGFIQFHFDEKWIFNSYIRKFVNIEPSVKELSFFLNSLIEKTKKKVIITTGVQVPALLESFMQNNTNKDIACFKNLNFFELENIILNADLLISCHGATSHVAAAGDVKQIDVIDSSYNYSFWTKHFRNYTSVKRNDFQNLSENLLNLI